MSYWYPQCWVELQMRPEDFIAVPAPPPVPAGELPSDPVLASGFIPFTKAVIPEECVVSRRSYREGDEARIIIPWRSLQVDVRTIRQMTVTIYMGVMSPELFAETQGQIQTAAPIALIPKVDPLTGQSNEVFRGFVDDIKLSLGEEGGTYEITARDVTGFFIDAEVQVGLIHGLPNTMRLDEVIAAIIEGDAAAKALPPGAVLESTRLKDQVVDEKRDAKRLQRRLAAKTRQLQKVTARLADNPASPSLNAESATLTGVISLLTTQLGAAKTKALANIAAVTVPSRIGLPGAEGVKVVNETGEDPLPMLKDVKASWNDSSKTLKKGRRGNAKNSQEKISYWDWITDMCVSLGYICYFRTPTQAVGSIIPPAELVIARPRTFYPEASGELHRFTYGLNCDSLAVTRAYTGKNVPTNILVKAISADTGDHISVIFPPPLKSPVNRSGASPTGRGDRVEVTTMIMDDRIPGNNPEFILQRMAQSIFEQLARCEMTVQVETETLAAKPSNRGTGAVDMFSLKAGDSAEISVLGSQTVAGNTFVTTFGDDTSVTPDVRTEQLVVGAGFQPTLAAAIVAAENNPKLQKVFRVRSVEIKFDSESEGFKFSVELMNYLDARVGLLE